MMEKECNIKHILSNYNPLFVDPATGISFYIFYVPIYLIYLAIWNFLPLYLSFYVKNLILKMPPIIGDIITTIGLYKLLYLLRFNKRKIYNISMLYYLNPYVIWQSSIIGHAESLTSGMLLWSLIFLTKNRHMLLGMFTGLAIFFRYIPLLLIPNLICISCGKARFKVLTSLLFVSCLLSLPYFMIYKELKSPSAVLHFMRYWLSAGEIKSSQGIDPWLFRYNYTGYLSLLGLWNYLRPLVSHNTFIALGIFTVLYFTYQIKRMKNKDSRSILYILVREINIIFALFMLTIPLCQHHYLNWLIPFLLLSCYACKVTPSHIFHMLWITNLLIDPIFKIYPLFYFVPTLHIPGIPEEKWLFRNLNLQASLSYLHATLLLITVISNYIPAIDTLVNRLILKLNSKRYRFLIFAKLYDLKFQEILALYLFLDILTFSYNFMEELKYINYSLNFLKFISIIYAMHSFAKYLFSKRSSKIFSLKLSDVLNLFMICIFIYLNIAYAYMINKHIGYIIEVILKSFIIFLLLVRSHNKLIRAFTTSYVVIYNCYLLVILSNALNSLTKFSLFIFMTIILIINNLQLSYEL